MTDFMRKCQGVVVDREKFEEGALYEERDYSDDIPAREYWLQYKRIKIGTFPMASDKVNLWIRVAQELRFWPQLSRLEAIIIAKEVIKFT